MPTKGRPVTISRGGISARFAAVLLATTLLVLALAWSKTVRSQNYESTISVLVDLTNVAQVAKASPGSLLYASCFNPNATTVYVQFFDSVGAVVVGTTVPTFSWAIPPTSASGQLPPPNPARSYFASAGMQAAAATSATGGTAPSSNLNCDFSHR